MSTHSSILAWRISWTEEINGLQAMGSKESDTTEATQHACTQCLWSYFYSLYLYTFLRIPSLFHFRYPFNFLAAFSWSTLLIIPWCTLSISFFHNIYFFHHLVCLGLTLGHLTNNSNKRKQFYIVFYRQNKLQIRRKRKSIYLRINWDLVHNELAQDT